MKGGIKLYKCLIRSIRLLTLRMPIFLYNISYRDYSDMNKADCAETSLEFRYKNNLSKLP